MFYMGASRALTTRANYRRRIFSEFATFCKKQKHYTIAKNSPTAVLTGTSGHWARLYSAAGPQ